MERYTQWPYWKSHSITAATQKKRCLDKMHLHMTSGWWDTDGVGQLVKIHLHQKMLLLKLESMGLQTNIMTVNNSFFTLHHTSNVCRAAYFHIRALRHIRPSLTEDMAITVAVSVVHSRLDYANSLIHGHTNVKDCSLFRILLLELSWRTTTTCHLAISYINCTGYLFSPELSSR